MCFLHVVNTCGIHVEITPTPTPTHLAPNHSDGGHLTTDQTLPTDNQPSVLPGAANQPDGKKTESRQLSSSYDVDLEVTVKAAKRLVDNAIANALQIVIMEARAVSYRLTTVA